MDEREEQRCQSGASGSRLSLSSLIDAREVNCVKNTVDNLLCCVVGKVVNMIQIQLQLISATYSEYILSLVKKIVLKGSSLVLL